MQGSARIDELRQKFHENPRRYFAPLANEYRKAGDPEQAIAICRAHLAQQPGHMSGHVVYGQALYDANRIDEARTVFEKALSLDPDNAIVLRQLGDIARQRGETAEAKHWYGRALDADPNNSEIAAYIAELTEPLTESAEAVVAGIAAPVDSSMPAPAPVAAEVAAPEISATVSEAVEEAVRTEEAQPAAELETVESSAGERARRDTPVATPIVPLADVSWRKTPPHEDSPFVTRTMAELYAKQGYSAAALDVYRQLSLTNPDDQEILSRIRELSGDEGASRSADSEVESSPVAEPDAELVASEESEPAFMADDVSSEFEAELGAQSEPASPAAIPVVDASQAVPGRAEALAAAAPPDWTEVNEEPVYTPAVEEIEPEPKPPSQAENRHFTELDLSKGDAWDTDTWGAGFSADESTDIELDVPDAPIVHLSPESETAFRETAPPSEAVASETEAETSQESAPEPTGTAAPTDWERATADAEPTAVEAEPVAVEEEPPVAEAEPAVVEEEPAAVEEEPAAVEEEPAAVEAEPAVASVSASEDFVEAERFVAAGEESAAEVEDEPQLVAYSPQPPDDKDLPHYEPKGPTVREFFATLGARRPPSSESAQSFTARAAVPSHENPSDYPLAASAFADLFPDSPITEEDTRAAFALSGAMSGTPAGAENPSAAETKRNTPPSPAAPVDNNQESEEDIRRFREWLDGLAES